MTLERIAVIGSRQVVGQRIGVDPHGQTSKADAAGDRPEVVLAGWQINDGLRVREPRSFGTASADCWSL